MTNEQLRAELAAFDADYLAKHGVHAALCDLPAHLIGVATDEDEDDDMTDGSSDYFVLTYQIAGDKLTYSSTIWADDLISARAMLKRTTPQAINIRPKK